MKVVTYSPAAQKALRKHRRDAAAIMAKVRQYAMDPASLAANVKALQGQPGYRLRVGEYRVIFEETDTEVRVMDLGVRGSIYT